MSRALDRRIGGIWYIFGERGDCVDVSDETQNDVFIAIPRSTALKLIDARSRFLAECYALEAELGTGGVA